MENSYEESFNAHRHTPTPRKQAMRTLKLVLDIFISSPKLAGMSACQARGRRQGWTTLPPERHGWA